MKTKQVIFPLVFFVVALAACTKQTPCVPTGEVRFTSRIATLDDGTDSRVTNNQWAASGSRIGIYMINNDEILCDDAIAEGASNREYVAATAHATAGFRPVSDDQTIYYPMDGTKKVGFIAYYPYREAINDYTYGIDLSDQALPEEIDLLYSNNATGKSKGDNVELVFEHQLSLMLIDIVPGDGVEHSDLTNLSVVIREMNTQASMSLTDGSLTIAEGQPLSDITLNTIDGDGLQHQAILLPEDLNGKRVEFRLNNTLDEVFVWTIGSGGDDTGVLEPGHRYTYTITLSRTGITVTGSIEDWTEGPANLTGTAD